MGKRAFGACMKNFKFDCLCLLMHHFFFFFFFLAKLNLLFFYSELSATWPNGSESRFYDGNGRKVDGSTPTQASLLRPWIRFFTIIISAWRNLISSK